MDPKIMEIAQRVKGLREIMEISTQEMAASLNLTEAEYLVYENGEQEFTLSLLYLCAAKFKVDIVELLTGENPHLSGFSVVRNGNGLPFKRREGFEYFHLAATFKDKVFEPFYVKAPYHKDNDTESLVMSSHAGQEFDYVLKGRLRMIIDGREFILNAGDAVTYDSSKGHGMNATGGEDCYFLAIILKKQ